jgi:hypothetical protein
MPIAIVALACALVAVAPARAQSASPGLIDQSHALDLRGDWSSLDTLQTACTRAIPRGHMFVAPVLLRASLADSDNAALSAQADLLAQDVAQKILAELGAQTSELRDVDSTFTPAAVPARLTVTFRPDGSANRSAMSMSGDTMATTMLTRAFDALRASSEAAMVWPDGYRADSIVVRIELTSATVTPNGNVLLYATKHPAFGVFRLLAPSVSPALPRPNQPAPRYPAEAEEARVEAFVVLRFVIDTNGRAVPESIRDVREWGRQRMAPDAREYYDAFARATRDAVVRWRFTPARIDACPVRQRVDLPIKFAVPGHM